MTVTSLFVYYFGLCLLFELGMLSFLINNIDIIYNNYREMAIVA